jgi:SOS response regulatory protein OraA/RecX
MARAHPPKITALDPTPNNPMSVRVLVNGKAAATLSRPRCDELKLHVGQPWTAALQRRVQAQADQDAARDAALKRLGRSALSTAALEAHLTAKGHAALAVRAAITELVATGWMNDRAFAEHQAERLATGKPFAREAIAAVLQEQGVSQSESERAAAKAAPSLPAKALAAEALAARRAGVRMNTMAGRMARRGFDQDAIFTALRAAGYAVEDE